MKLVKYRVLNHNDLLHTSSIVYIEERSIISRRVTYVISRRMHSMKMLLGVELRGFTL